MTHTQIPVSTPIDLTLPVKPGMRGVESQPKYSLARDGWNAATWNLYSHSGTHVDAPIHFGASSETIDEMPLDRFHGLAWVAHLENVQPKQLLTPSDLGRVAEKVNPGDGLLIRTDWSKHLTDPEIYRDQLPRISEELANWCIQKRIKILGVEPPSVADVNNLPEVTRIHRLLLGAQITIVESLCNLDKLNEQVYFMALPLKLVDGDGCPVRAIAFPLN